MNRQIEVRDKNNLHKFTNYRRKLSFSLLVILLKTHLKVSFFKKRSPDMGLKSTETFISKIWNKKNVTKFIMQVIWEFAYMNISVINWDNYAKFSKTLIYQWSVPRIVHWKWIWTLVILSLNSLHCKFPLFLQIISFIRVGM